MSDSKNQMVDLTVAGIEFAMTVQPNRVMPSWLPEALLLGKWWQTSGLLATGACELDYEVCAGEASLAAFLRPLRR